MVRDERVPSGKRECVPLTMLPAARAERGGHHAPLQSPHLRGVFDAKFCRLAELRVTKRLGVARRTRDAPPPPPCQLLPASQAVTSVILAGGSSPCGSEFFKDQFSLLMCIPLMSSCVPEERVGRTRARAWVRAGGVARTLVT